MNEELMKELTVLAEQQEASEQRYDTETDEWWNELSQEDQMRAFYSVVKRLVEGELVERGSYRYVLYQTFKFPAEAYGIGVQCGYLTLHNSIDREVERFT